MIRLLRKRLIQALFWLAAAGALLLVAPRIAAQLKRPPATLAASQRSTVASPGVSFADITRTAGIGEFRYVSGSPAKDYILEATGGGCALFDFDNDGWLDIYLVNGGTIEMLRGQAGTPPPRAALYRNNRDGTFVEVTARAGVANERWGQGVCVGDIDNDGWADLYVTNFGRNRLYRNNGDGTFTDIAEKGGVTVGGWSTGCAFGDYDGDGRLDLFVAGYIELDLQNLPPAGSGAAPAETRRPERAEQPKSEGMGAAYSAGMAACLYRNQRVMCGPRGLKGAPDHLFRNLGNGQFAEVSAQAGVADKAGYYGFGVAWVDLDDDARLDLVVANDSTPNHVYRNLGNGTFEDVSYASGAALNEHGREQAHMGIAIGDYDADGRADIHITNFSDDSNVLYHNDGRGSFSDTTFQTGLGEPTIPFLGWGTNFLDYDNDGALDLLVANGHVYPIVDQADWNTSYRQRLLLFRNLKNRFHEAGSNAGEALNLPRASRGSAIGDIDNDGDLDILLNNLDEPPALLRNDGANTNGHWLTIRLLGDPKQKTPRDAIGSVVFCLVNGRRLREEIASGRSYQSQSDLRAHFGLGSAARIDRLEVRWANGKLESYSLPALNRAYLIEQGKGIVPQ